MKMYCFSCGAATNYTYSSGKPTNCGTCKQPFGGVATKSAPTENSVEESDPDIKAAKEVEASFKWVRNFKLSELFDLSVTND